MAKTISPHHKLAFAILAIALFTLGYYWGNQYQQPAGWQGLAEAQPLIDVELNNEYHQKIKAKDWQGYWSLVSAGPWLQCEQRAAYFVWVWNYLAADPKLQEQSRWVLIDPSQPPAEAVVLQKIDRYLHAFTVLQGEPAPVNQLINQLQLSADCRGRIALINPQGQWLGWLAPNLQPKQVADIIRFLDQKS